MDKEKKYQKIKAWANGAEYNLGKKIDSEIKETVIFLNCLNFRTIGSCEGHLKSEKFTHGPYLGFHSKLTEELLDKENKEWKKSRKKLIEFTKKNEKLRKKARLENIEIGKKIINLLSEFYKSRSSNQERRLFVQFIGYYFGPRIECQGSEYLALEKKEIRVKKLKIYQLEFKAFTNFLKRKYFKN